MGQQSSSPGQVITLPTGGGALRGIGETFAPDLHTGVGIFNVPLSLPAGRNGFTPELVLAYNSGAGHGRCGLGWAVNVPAITRKVAKGVPRYDPSDVFLLTGADDLVRVARSPGGELYRPRTEGLFARIERRTGTAGDTWEVRTKDGLINLYGTSPDAVVRNPADPRRVFAWSLSETRDAFGNRIVYEYAADAPADPAQLERQQERGHVFAGRILSRIRYVDFDEGGQTRYLCSVTFEDEDRPDPRSDYRAGFELRSARRCKRIVVRTHVDPVRPQRVLAYELVYLDERTDFDDLESRLPSNGVSLLSRVRAISYDDAAPGTEGLADEQLPPIDLGYTRFTPEERRFEPVEGSLPSQSLSSADLELVDLTGDGLPDILELNGTARWWRNLGGSFDVPREIALAPAGVGLRDRGVRLLDANGDARPDLLVQQHGGYYPTRFRGDWDPRSFTAYASMPSVDLDDPAVRLVDLDGDGLTDIVRSGARLECFFNNPSPQRAWRRTRFASVGAGRAAIDFADPRVRWADMNGDGLQDLVVVHRTCVEYRPSLGHGDFGEPIQMERSPRLPADYAPSRVLLGDVDGDGAADVVLVEDRRVTIWINRGGNAFGDPFVILGTPRMTNADAVRLADVAGRGVPGVLWTTDAGASLRPRMLFLALTEPVKPYLLCEVDNNLGALTRIAYRSSTDDFLEDAKRRATAWRTSLPFPVWVVGRVESVDLISGSRLVTDFSYHHGCWEGREAEFRGFARVHRRDTRISDDYARGLFPEFGGTQAPTTPAEQRTWFYVGALELDGAEELDLADEFWSGDNALERPVATSDLLASLSPDARREALRSLRGKVRRTELYGLDGTTLETRPYSVSESTFAIAAVLEGNNGPTLQEGAVAPFSPLPRVFFPHAAVDRETQWERGDDPRTTLTFSEGFDGLGRVHAQTTLALPRRSARRARFEGAVVGTLQPDERRVLATHTRTSYAEPDLAQPSLYMHDRVRHLVTFELTTAPEVVETDSASLAAVRADHTRAAAEVHRTFKTALQGWRVGAPVPGALRLLSHTRNSFDGAPYVGRSDGRVGPAGSPTRTETLVFTDAELDAAYGARRPDYLGGGLTLPVGAPGGTAGALGYRRRAATVGEYCEGYYRDTTRQSFDARGLVIGIRDPLGYETSVTYDQVSLLPVGVVDPAGLETRAVNDYRVLKPRRVTDPNGNATLFEYASCGLVSAQWREGRVGEGGTPALPDVSFAYDLRSFQRTRHDANPQPAFVHTTRRSQHAIGATSNETIESREFSDGFGRLVQSRISAEELVLTDLGLPAQAGTLPGQARGARASDRVVVKGWQTYDDKEHVRRKYEPFFSRDFAFQPEGDARRGGFATFGYDAPGRLVRTVKPDGSEERVVMGVPVDLDDPTEFAPTPWESYAYDANDLDGARASPRSPTTTGAPTDHRWTPSSRVFDGLGRVLCQTERNGQNPADDWFVTRSTYDVSGNVLSGIDPLGRVAFRHRYDLLNRPLRAESLDGGIRTAVPDARGSPVEERDSVGALVLREYDILGRLVHVWARDRGIQALTLRESLQYGDGGTPAQAPAARAANRARNRLGRLSVHRDEAGRTRFLRYDFKGNVVDTARQVVDDAVVASGWVADWARPGAETDLDPAGYRIETRYDALDRPVETTYPTEARPRQPGQSPARAVVTRHYDRGGSLEGVEVDGQPFVTQICYDARGQRILVAYGNGLMTRFAYDPQSFRLARMRTDRVTVDGTALTWDRNGAPLHDTTYRYDPVGNVVSIEERRTGSGVAAPGSSRNRLLRSFAYDPLYRLLSATGRACTGTGNARPLDDIPGCAGVTATQGNAPDVTELYTESYDWDANRNLLGMTYDAPSGRWRRRFGIGGQPSNGDWRLAATNRATELRNGTTTHTLTFDASGNLIRQNVDRSYTWNHAGRVVTYRVQASGSVSLEARYLYGADGRRVKKYVRRGSTAPETTVVVSPEFEYRQWRENGTTKRQNLLHLEDAHGRFAIVRLGDVARDDPSPAIRYHLSDHLGSSTMVVGGDGTWVNREEYFPFGETSFGSFAHKRFRFCGKERDEESGLAYHGARYYAPQLMRWISVDPETQDGPNLYAYCRGNPLTLVDPGGHSSGSAPQEQAVAPAPPPADAPPVPAQGVTVRGAGGVCTTCNDPNDPVVFERLVQAARAEIHRKTREQVEQAQQWWDAVYPVYYEQEDARTPIIVKMFPRGTTNDPVHDRVVEILGPRPQQPEEAVIEAVAWMVVLHRAPPFGKGYGFRPPKTPSYQISRTIVELDGRMVVWVRTEEGVFAFYRRTGMGGPAQGWARAGEWVPFHGLAESVSIQAGNGRTFVWFIKPLAGRTGAAGSEAISVYLRNYFRGGTAGHNVLRMADAEAKVINEWLRMGGVNVGGAAVRGQPYGGMLIRNIPGVGSPMGSGTAP